MATTFRPLRDTSTFRRIAASMWRRPTDPTIYGFVDIDVTETLGFIERFRAATGKKLTMTHVVTRAVSRAFAAHPDLNAKVRFGGRLEARSSVDVFVSVATAGGDLSGIKVDGADTLSLEAVVETTTQRVRETRAGTDETYRRSRSTLAATPWWCLRPLLWLTDMISNEVGLDLPGLGMPRDPFGTAVVTNVGTFGIDTAFAPFVPLGRCPMLLLVTEVKKRPMVVGDAVVARPVLRLCGTFDHRIIDGAQAGLLADAIRAYVSDPASVDAAFAAPAEPSERAEPRLAAAV